MTRKSEIQPSSRTALFPGSFNPFTIGHKSLVDRALLIADRVIIAIGINLDKEDSSDIAQRIRKIQDIFPGDERIRVTSYNSLTGQLCSQLHADFIIRGVRNTQDFDYEMNMATANRNLFGIETVLLPTTPELAWISSSTVRELQKFGHDTSDLIP